MMPTADGNETMPADPPTTDRDRDCATLARMALFPPRINRDGTHPTIFPSLEALQNVREDARAADPDRAPSSFFPNRVVLVRELGRRTEGGDVLQWNGQPDIDVGDATFDVIPRMLGVKCMDCAGLALSPGAAAFSRLAECPPGSSERPKLRNGERRREIVVCTDRALVGGDYDPDRGVDVPPPRSLAAVEEALAREVTKVRDALRSDRGDTSTPKSGGAVAVAAASAEVRAAQAAECYFAKHGSEVKRGSGLPMGYSILPEAVRRMARDRCVRSTAIKNVRDELGAEEGRRAVEEAMKK